MISSTTVVIDQEPYTLKMNPVSRAGSSHLDVLHGSVVNWESLTLMFGNIYIYIYIFL